MKLLFVTQVVDPAHPVLGFTCGWIRALATQCTSLVVVGQAVTQPVPAFPSSVTLCSMEKENGASRLRQIVRFWRLLWKHRASYDAVLVHMTPIWVILGFPLCFILRKRLYLWYEARGARWNLRMALMLVAKAFSASPSGMPVASSRSRILGHGIDTVAFHPADHTDSHALITVGRITDAKNLSLILEAFAVLPKDCRLTIVGSPVTGSDHALEATLKLRIAQPDLAGRVSMRVCTHEELPALLSTSALFLHAATTSLDKAVLEAMACGVPVVSCSPAVQSILPEMLRALPTTLADRAREALLLDDAKRVQLAKDLRDTVVRLHSLDTLAQRLVSEMRI